MPNANRRRPKHPFSHLGELFDASAHGLVTLLLLAASFFATWRGMHDFISSYDVGSGRGTQALVLLVVVTLSLAMYVALREMIAPYNVTGLWSAFWKRAVAFILYAVLALWSVGFGYGFWWSLVAGQSATEATLQRTVTAVRDETSDMRARLAAASSVMASAEQLSNLKADQEATRGGTCGVASPPGDGPLARARSETQAQIAVLADTVRDDWQAPLGARLSSIETNLQSALGGGAASTDRKATFETVARQTQTAAREIGADATARGRTIAAQLRSKAEQLSVPPENGRVTYCYDPDLAASLRTAADELAQDYVINVPTFSYAEGADGVARAIEQLAESVVSALPGINIQPAGAARPVLAGRDIVALMAAIGIDLALFILALLRGGSGREGDDMLALASELPPRDGGGVAKADRDRIGPAPVSVPRSSRQALLEDHGGAPDPDDDPAIPDADYEERPPATRVINTFDPRDTQVEFDEQIAELLDQVRSHSEAVHAAQRRGDKSRMEAHLATALRELQRRGYTAVGRSDRYFKPDLHQIYEEQTSPDVPAGQILRIVLPRFVDADGRTLFPALVILSTGRGPGNKGGGR